MSASSRRALLTRTALASVAIAALGLAGCTVTKNGSNTTVTIDTAKIVTDGSAIVQALAATLAAPSLVVLLGTKAGVAITALAGAQAALADLQALTGGSVSVSVDPSKVQSLVASLLADAQTVLKLVQGVTGQITGALATTIGNYVAAAQALLPFVALAASVALPAGAAAGGGGMGEAQAVSLIRAQRGM